MVRDIKAHVNSFLLYILPQPVQITEPIKIGDWLASYKLTDYTALFESNGYDTTDFLYGILAEELGEIGVQKPGHRKKIMTALAAVHHKEIIVVNKPVSKREK